MRDLLHKVHFVLVSAALLFCILTGISFTSVAQRANFSGRWLLKEHKSLLGKDYINGLPHEIIVKQSADSVVIVRVVPTESKVDSRTSESIAFNGHPSIRTTKARRNAISVITWSNDNKVFVESIRYSYPDNDQGTQFWRTESWNLSEADSNLSIKIESMSNVLPDENWSMEGKYVKSSPSSAEGYGIEFETGRIWKEITTKASAERKYIFVDCFTTWCAPCKKMDIEVYTSPLVGKYINDNFVSVKIQMDSSKNDNEDTRKWYAIAHEMQEKYKIDAYPTFLFFSPEGNIIHKDIGSKSIKGFIDLAKAAADVNQQYYILLEAYRQGRMDKDKIADLAYLARRLGDNSIADSIAHDYINNYLLALSDDKLLRKKPLVFMVSFPALLSSKERFFSIIYKYGKKIDSILNRPEFAESLVDYIIFNEIIKPEVMAAKESNREPKWKKLELEIRDKYNADYGHRNILGTKIQWYKGKKEWAKYTRLIVQKVTQTGLKGEGPQFYKMQLNNSAWEIFLYSEKKNELYAAITWVDKAINADSSDYISTDTKANLLYKTGHREEAIKVEKRAIELGSKEEQRLGIKKGSFTRGMEESMYKMNWNKPTWILPVGAQSRWFPQRSALSTRWTTEISSESPLPEYPRPQMMRSSWKNLNGLWDYLVADSNVAIPKQFKGQILVPYPIESALSGVKRVLMPSERLWYRKNIHLVALGKKRILLHFGAVDWKAIVYINKTIAGEHQGGYSNFDIDITGLVKKGDNELLVKVYDPTDQGPNPHGKQSLKPGGIMYSSCSGIWQTVWMEIVPQCYINDLYMTPNVDSGRLALTIDLKGGIGKYEVEAAVLSNGKEVSKQTSLDNNLFSDGSYNLHINLADAHLWSPNDPFLYDLIVKVIRDGQTVDEVKSYFGMRKINVNKDAHGQERIFLNNKYTFNLGVLDQGFWPDGIYTAPTDEALKFDIEAIKKMGFNTIRKHIKIEPARWYYYCDKLGVLVWQDMPFPASLAAKAKEVFEDEVAHSLRQLHNYPSIICWVLFNEGWNQYDQQRLTEWVKNEDPSRLIDGHSGENYDRNSPKGVDQKWISSDFVDIHSYPGPDIGPRLPGKASVLGEWGGVQVLIHGHQWQENAGWGYSTTEADDFARKYEFMVKHLKLFEEEGLSAAIYTQPFDVETEENGLITYDREIFKIPVEKIRAINNLIFSN